MILSAFFIPKGSIEHLFGKDHEGFIINLGGKNFYKAKFNHDVLHLEIEKNNSEYISNFYSLEISNISAIVGKNGIGKTTLLRAINEYIDKKSIRCLYIFEFDDKIHILNEIENQSYLPIGFTPIEITNKSFSKIFYSSETDLDLRDAILFTNTIDQNDTLEDIKFRQIRNNILFLTNPISQKIKDIYNDFPSYDKLFINVTKHKKKYFKDVYAKTNLGNQDRLQVLRTHIESDSKNNYDVSIDQILKSFYISLLYKIENEKDTGNVYQSIIDFRNKFKVILTQNNLIYQVNNYLSILTNKGLNSLFDELWKINENKNNDFIHNKSNFISDFEVIILSYLVLGTTFPRTIFQRYYSFDNIIKENNFKDKLNQFLILYLSNSCYQFIDYLNAREIEITPNNYTLISKEIISFSEIIKIKNVEGFDFTAAAKLAQNHINIIIEINNYYDYINEIIINNKISIVENKLIFELNIDSINTFNMFIDRYLTFIKILKHLPIKIELFDFEPNKILSTGEKSILKFYANIYNYIQSNFSKDHYKRDQFYLFLLDEPELGYHPLWKKKFINALSKTFPLLFEEFNSVELNTQMIEDLQNKHYLQIIFTTHDPLTLSDIPSNNIVYLDQTKNLVTKIDDGSTNSKKTFGANIHELLADSFFISDGLIGEFAKEKIDFVIEKLNSKILINEKNKTSNTSYDDEKELIWQIISLIDEPIIKFRLIEMFNLAFTDKTPLDSEIELLEEKLRILKSKKND